MFVHPQHYHKTPSQLVDELYPIYHLILDFGGWNTSRQKISQTISSKLERLRPEKRKRKQAEPEENSAEAEPEIEFDE
jgi:hypothetical protein